MSAHNHNFNIYVTSDNNDKGDTKAESDNLSFASQTASTVSSTPKTSTEGLDAKTIMESIDYSFLPKLKAKILKKNFSPINPFIYKIDDEFVYLSYFFHKFLIKNNRSQAAIENLRILMNPESSPEVIATAIEAIKNANASPTTSTSKANGGYPIVSGLLSFMGFSSTLKPNVDTLFLMGYCHLHGLGVPINKVLGEELMKKVLSLQEDYPPAAFEYAQCLLGRATDKANKDYKLSLDYFEKAAKQNYAPAQNYLGYLYSKEDEKRAREYFVIAEKQDFAIAQYNMANEYFNKIQNQWYHEGINNPGIVWMLKAATQGYNRALTFFVQPALKSVIEKSFRSIRQASNEMCQDQLRAVAQYVLATYYDGGMCGLPKDPRLAAQLYQQAAAQGHSEALVMLAGLQVELDGGHLDKSTHKKEVIELYTCAGLLKHSGALYMLAGVYLQDNGIEHNKEKAILLLYAANEATRIHGGDRGVELRLLGLHLKDNLLPNPNQMKLQEKLDALSIDATKGDAKATQLLAFCAEMNMLSETAPTPSSESTPKHYS